MLVVVDRQPTVRRPTAEVFGEHLREKRRFSIGILGYLKPFEQTPAGAWDYRGGRCDERARDNHATSADDRDGPGTTPTSRSPAASPLLQQHGLALARIPRRAA